MAEGKNTKEKDERATILILDDVLQSLELIFAPELALTFIQMVENGTISRELGQA